MADNVNNNNNNYSHYNFYWFLELVLVIAVVYYVNYEPPKPSSVLIVAIFSAPDHFEQRLSLRRSWLKLAQPVSSVKYYFVLGNTMCPIPPEDRSTPYGCELRPILRGSEVFSSLQPYSPTTSSCADGYSFAADYDITVTHIGVLECLNFDVFGPLRVKLMDGFDGKILASVTFQSGDFHTKAISPVRFPRLAEGLVVLEFGNRSGHISCCSTVGKRSHGAITLLSLVKNNRLLPLEEVTGVSSFINYKVIENNSFAAVAKRSASWKSAMENIYGVVAKESEKYGDILLVNVTDVYRNLPKKLVQFLTNLVAEEEAMDFEYVLKTDDDTFIDLRRVLAELEDPWTWIPGLWWWGFFKEYWHVPRTGKWREEWYRSATYPPFPCGGGYVINKATVRYLAAAEEHLRLFQGEDVSLGIWLSAVNIQTHRESEHTDRAVSYFAIMTGQCEESCIWTCGSKPSRRPSCNRVQLSIPQMYKAWEQYRKTGSL